jgi:hypothetical protein
MPQATTVPNFSFEDLLETDRLELPIVSPTDPSLKLIATIFFDRSLQRGFNVEMQFFLNNVLADGLKQLEGSAGFSELINSYKKLVSDEIKNNNGKNAPSNESKNNNTKNKLEAKFGLGVSSSFNKIINDIASIFYSTKKLKTLAKVISYLDEFNGTLDVYTTNRGKHEAKSLARTTIELDADIITIFDKNFSSSSFDARLRKELTSLHYFNVGLVNNLLFQEINRISRSIRGLIYIARSVTAITAISWNFFAISQGVYSSFLGGHFVFHLTGSPFESLIPSIAIPSLVYYLIPRIVSFFVRRKVIIAL